MRFGVFVVDCYFAVWWLSWCFWLSWVTAVSWFCCVCLVVVLGLLCVWVVLDSAIWFLLGLVVSLVALRV